MLQSFMQLFINLHSQNIDAILFLSYILIGLIASMAIINTLKLKLEAKNWLSFVQDVCFTTFLWPLFVLMWVIEEKDVVNADSN